MGGGGEGVNFHALNGVSSSYLSCCNAARAGERTGSITSGALVINNGICSISCAN